MIKKRLFFLYKTFIYISLFNFIFGQISVGSTLYHIPPNPPIIGETVQSLENRLSTTASSFMWLKRQCSLQQIALLKEATILTNFSY